MITKLIHSYIYLHGGGSNTYTCSYESCWYTALKISRSHVRKT